MEKGSLPCKNCPFNHDFTGREPLESRGKASICMAFIADDSSASVGAFATGAMQYTSDHSRSPLE